MPELITVTVPELPALTQVTGDELVAVWKGDHLARLPQAAFRGTRTFTGPADPPNTPSDIMALSPILDDRWRNTETGDEWKVSALDPFTWLPDGNVRGRDGETGGLGPSYPGPKGPPGRDGDQREMVAGASIPASTYVIDAGNGVCIPADLRVASHRGRGVGVVTDAVSSGALATVSSAALIQNVSGNFGPGDPIFPSDGSDGSPVGSLTSNPPNSDAGAVWRQQIGRASSTSSIAYRPSPAVSLITGSLPATPAGNYVFPGTGPDTYAAGDDPRIVKALPNDSTLDIAASLTAVLGAPNVLASVAGRIDILSFPVCRILKALGDAADWTPIFQAACATGLPIYFGKHRYMMRSRTMPNPLPAGKTAADYPAVVDIRTPVSVDVEMHPEAVVVCHERVLRRVPEAYDAAPDTLRTDSGPAGGHSAPVFSFFATGGATQAWGTATQSYRWVGGTISFRENFAASQVVPSSGGYSGWDISLFGSWYHGKTTFDCGTSAPSAANVGTGYGDTHFTPHNCGPGIFEWNISIGPTDEGFYGNGVGNAQVSLGANPIFFPDARLPVARVTYPFPHGKSVGDVVNLAAGGNITVGAVAGTPSFLQGFGGLSMGGGYQITNVLSDTVVEINTRAAAWRYPAYGTDPQRTYTANNSIIQVGNVLKRANVTYTPAKNEPYDPAKWSDYTAPVGESAIGGTGFNTVLVNTQDLPNTFAQNPALIGTRVWNNLFYRCAGAITMKRCGAFADVAYNTAIQCGNFILAGIVGTDIFGHGKRWTIHHNTAIQCQGRVVTLVNSKHGSIHDNAIIDYATQLYDLSLYSTASSPVCAIWLRGCSNITVTHNYIANETPEWYQKPPVPADAGSGPAAIVLDMDTNGTFEPTHDCTFAYNDIINSVWSVVENATCYRNEFVSSTPPGLYRAPALLGTDTKVDGEILRTYTPSLAFGTAPTSLTYGSRSIQGRLTGRYYEFEGYLTVATISGGSGAVRMTGLPANRGTIPAPITIFRDGSSGAGALVGYLDPNGGDINLRLDSGAGALNLFTADAVQAGTKFFFSGRYRVA